MKSRRQTGMKKAVAEALAGVGAGNFLVEARIMNAWDRIVGPQLASRSVPYQLGGGVLTVAVFNSVWMTQLSFFREELAGKVNGFLGAQTVGSVRLVLQKKPDWWPPSRGRGRRKPPPEPSAEDRRMIEEACGGIADAELKELVRRVLSLQATARLP